MKKVKVSSLKPNGNNPRLIKDEKFLKLVESIKQFPAMMSIRPMIIDENNILLGGNMRLKAIQHLEMKEIPEDWVKKASELTEEEKKRFIITDNNSFGEYDWDIIANEWGDLPIEDWGVDLPTYTGIEEGSDGFTLPDGDKAPFQQMTFTLADAQAERIKEALKEVEIMDGTQYGNENSNGNALHQIILEWVEQRILSSK